MWRHAESVASRSSTGKPETVSLSVNLNIQKVDTDDFGTYECIAWNSEGSVTKSIDIIEGYKILLNLM